METITAERDAIKSELTSATVDMKSEFLNALSQYGAISEHLVSVECLRMVYGPLQCLNILHSKLGFYSPYLNKVLKIFPFHLQTCHI